MIMNKSEIQQQLRESHARFIKQIVGLSDQDFLRSSNGKWTAGQQLEHIIKSVRPVTLAFSLPRFMLKIAFGKANRPSRSYDGLVEKYQAKLAQGGKAPGRFVPNTVVVADRDKLSRKLQALIDSLISQFDSFSEEQLDLLILPHPLMGKLTLREMLYFTIYHVGHHKKQVVQNLRPQQQPV